MAFVRTVKLAELPAGTIRELQVEGKAVAVANVGGKDLCDRQHMPASRGAAGAGFAGGQGGDLPVARLAI